ncbi:hypothetical protein HIM_11410 [Hirsutella minnesotensis 3608]|uniref:Reverse transcriptase n=1 Tax=Hirsutella minnesotensis 3608 TaxID=1043627 RepID=A0A0F7ZJ33_9HYPO|nr:hypothetical protein HIM_11410 [Hirsutella minnesotensis 3608]
MEPSRSHWSPPTGSIRQAIESEVRAKEGQATWRCAAVVRSSRNTEQVKIICRDEIELQRVKEGAQNTAVTGARVMRDQLYPVKVDNVNRTAILDGEGNIQQGAAEALGAENNVTIETGKAYGSMVVYVTKNDAKKLLDGKYFDLAGESACTNPFEPRKGPMQCYNCQEIGHKAFRCKKPQMCGSILQLNVRKREPVQQSLMNDEDLRDYGVLAVSEPHARKIDGKVVTSPMMHSNWTRILPTYTRDAPWPTRSMLWVRNDVEVEQIPVPSADLTAAVLRLPERGVLVVSVYVEGKSTEALKTTTGLLHDLIRQFRHDSGTRTDVVLAGDFNSHDLLWGGDEISDRRQGEAEPIIDLMNEHGLRSLLPRGMKTWQDRDQESTIDLILTTSELADEMNYDAKALFKNAPWSLIKARVKDDLRPLPWAVDVQTQTDQLTRVVLEAVHELTPRARPSPYAKRWWTKNLTRLRRVYTFWRNLARTQRRAGQLQPDLERRAKEAAKEYHDTIRSQRKAHWNDFLADDVNLWGAAKYLKLGEDTMGDKVPPLRRRNGSSTKDKAEQTDELLSTFCPPLPTRIEDEGVRSQRKAVRMPDLTLEEFEEKIMAAKPWKAPGEDELPTVVWRQLWPVVQYRVFALFKASLRDGIVPRQWRSAKIIPLRKSDKEDYTAWRSISLLSTLGKILEAVVAERISYAVETHGLLPANHFGARKRRSAEQALLFLQEQIYRAWRNRKVLSLISFDVRGAYNGVCKDRLLDRMKARGIPADLIKWIDAFCTGRTASVVVNGYVSEQRELPQAGLPQGSPLSPILFLFFNADLVQRRIKAGSGSIAFVDDYSAWVTGPTAEANRAVIQSIINDALEWWEARSGATFEADKTTVIHFTRVARRDSDMSILIIGEEVKPRERTHGEGGCQRAQRCHVPEKIENAVAKGSETTVRSDSRAGHGLRLQCLDACSPRKTSGMDEQSTDDWDADHHGRVSYGRDGGGRSRSKHSNGRGTTHTGYDETLHQSSNSTDNTPSGSHEEQSKQALRITNSKDFSAAEVRQTEWKLYTRNNDNNAQLADERHSGNGRRGVQPGPRPPRQCSCQLFRDSRTDRRTESVHSGTGSDGDGADVQTGQPSLSRSDGCDEQPLSPGSDQATSEAIRPVHYSPNLRTRRSTGETWQFGKTQVGTSQTRRVHVGNSRQGSSAECNPGSIHRGRTILPSKVHHASFGARPTTAWTASGRDRKTREAHRQGVAGKTHPKKKSKGNKRLLILDGFSSHHTYPFIEYCRRNGIVLFSVPPHLTHLLQPLDVVVFQPLKHYHAKAVDLAVRDGCTDITKVEFLDFIQDVRKKIFRHQTIISAFRKTGIVPFNQEVVLAVMRARKNRTPSPELDSALQSSPFDTPVTLGQMHKTASHLEDCLIAAEDCNDGSILLENDFLVSMGQFIRGAISNSTELIQTKRDLGRTRLAEKTRQLRRAMKNTPLQSGGVLTVAQGRQMAARKGEIEFQRAQRKVEASRARYDNALKRWYSEAAKKARAMRMARQLGEMLVYSGPHGCKAIRRVGK